MNVESNRLQTFCNWPNNVPITPQRIARAGFFSTGQGLEVECFVCHGKISEWNYGEQVMSKHILLNPECPFVINPASCGNVPNTPSAAPSAAPSTSVISYKESPAIRLATFETWPSSNIVSPERLARAGFFYLGDGDNTKCAFCHGVVRAWEPGDDPDLEHKRHFPRCPFVIKVINLRLTDSNKKMAFHNVNVLVEGRNLDELGVQAHKGPKRTNYATLEARLQSFVGWSTDLIQTPDILAQAGFYYEGMGDQVRCFHCDGGLRHWDPHDDPWTEHARWFPNCSFVKLIKGQDFVTASGSEQGCENNVRASTRRSRRRQVNERQLQDHLASPYVAAALDAGLSRYSVRRAIEEKLQLTGIAFANADSLVEAALKVQEREEQEEEEEEEVAAIPVTDGQPAERNFRKELEDMVEQMVERAGDTPMTRTASLFMCTLENEIRRLREAALCKICMDLELSIVFLPCGHFASCANCVLSLEDCPLCRCPIQATVKAFLS